MRGWLILMPPTRVLPTHDGVGSRSRVASLMKQVSIQYKLGSAQQFVKSGILRGFPDFLKSDVFGIRGGHAFRLQE
jgi:hypothetical protein